MEIFLKLRVTVDDEQGLATLVHVGQIACETRKSCWKKTDPKAKGGWKAVNQTGPDMGPDSLGDYRALYNCE